MSPIDPLNPVLAQLRAQALAARRKLPRDEPGSAAAPERSADTEQESGWLGQVARGVLAIGRDDPQRRRKAFRFYLQSLLARECGVQQVGDPVFQELVDRVVETMDSDASLHQAMERAGELLLRTAGSDASLASLGLAADAAETTKR